MRILLPIITKNEVMLELTVVLSRGVANEFSKYLDTLNIKYELENYKKINVVFIYIDFKEKNHICDILSEFVINGYIKKYVNSCLLKEFYFFDENEREMVVQDILSKVKKADISQMIESFFDDKNEIILDGFFKFRMKDYIDYVDVLIDDAASNMTVKKEINEFVKLLRYFVSIGDSTCERVHVFKMDSDYILTDDGGNSPLDMTGVMYEFSDMEHLPEDELLNSLVSIAPKHIVMHNKSVFENEDMSIIYKVFENSIEFCDGKCERCREIYNIEKPHNM